MSFCHHNLIGLRQVIKIDTAALPDSLLVRGCYPWLVMQPYLHQLVLGSEHSSHVIEIGKQVSFPHEPMFFIGDAGQWALAIACYLAPTH